VSIWQLAVGRFLDGIAGGMVAVCVNTAIGQAYPEQLRPRSLTLMSTAWIIPSMVGPPLAGLVASWWSWRAVFFGLAVAWAAASWAQGRVLSRFPRHLLVALILAGSIGTAVLGTLPGAPSYAEGAALVAAAVGMGLLVPSLTVLSLATSPADRQGYASSAMQTAQNLGQVITLALATIVFETFAGPSATRPAGYAAAFALLAVPSVLAVLLAARTRRA